MNNCQRDKPSQHWALVGQQIKWLFDTGESIVIGLKPSDFDGSDYRLCRGPQQSLISTEWIQDFVEVKR